MSASAAAADVAAATFGFFRREAAGTVSTLGKNFASSYAIKPAEPLGKMYADYPWDPHAFVTAVLDGANSATYGNFAPGTAISGTDDARHQLVKKTLKFQILLMYAFHEIESALVKYKTVEESGSRRRLLEESDAATTTMLDGAVHAWDEFWAFYAGTLVSCPLLRPCPLLCKLDPGLT